MFDRQHIKRFLRPKYRKPKMIAFLQAAFVRGRQMVSDYRSLKLLWDERRLYNSQTLSLQTYLRNYFNDPTIEVVNQQSLTLKTYIYWLFQDQPKTYIYWLHESQPKYIYWLHEFSSNDFDFCINCPLSLQGSENEIRAIVEVMKLAGKRFKIVFL